MLITPNFHFNGDCAEALELYQRAFGGELTLLMHYRDADPADMSTEHMSDKEKSFVYHAEMIIGNQRFVFSDALQEIPKGQNLSIVVTFDHPDEAKSAYQALRESSILIHPITETTYSSFFVSLVDRFGMRWELMTEDKA